MFIQPVYNILLLPDVTYYFKKDFFAGICLYSLFIIYCCCPM